MLRFTEIEESFDILDGFLREQIALRKKEIREEVALGRNFDGGRKDVFSVLVRANEDINEKYPLDDNELVGCLAYILYGKELSDIRLVMPSAFCLQDMVCG